MAPNDGKGHDQQTARLSRAAMFEKLEGAKQQSSTTPTLSKIQRVPAILFRDPENFKKFYKPRAVAIGPIHHGKPEYERAQNFKYKLAADFIEESGETNEALCSKIQKQITELKACYVEEATTDYDDEYLASMLFLDGCSILQFIRKYKELGELFKLKRDLVAFEDQDLFLLENQLPYEVLDLLMSSSKEHVKLKKAIESFVQMHIFSPDPKINEQEDYISIEMPGCQPSMRAPTHLLELLRRRIVGPPVSQTTPQNAAGLQETTFRNVQELKAAGIYFRPSAGRLLKDVSFNTYLCFAGILQLPQIKVDDSMGPKFMNLIAFEMCPDFQNDFGITSYIGFLDSLIDNSDDVKHLRKTGILQNFLGSDEEVARLFNEIGTDLVPNVQTYRGVKEQIETHYKTMWKSWIAIFIHEHFSSPWTLLAFLGALSALVLSGIQTWYTLHPQAK